MKTGRKSDYVVKVYHGYGHTHNLVLYGHAFSKHPASREKFSTRAVPNIRDLLRLFFVKPIPEARVRLYWEGEWLEQLAGPDGFFKFEWESRKKLAAGWHPVSVELLNIKGNVLARGEGGVYVPHVTQFAFISDIDDTVMISHSATIVKRLLELAMKNPHTRSIFPGVAEHYKLLSLSHTEPDLQNPFFYVSSSEWNLYDYLNNFFTFNGLPKGAFLLNQLKLWTDLLKTGKTEHQGKLLRIVRIMETFPNQKFVLFGDNSQSDPDIYAKAAGKFKDRVTAVYIRNVRPSREASTRLAFMEMHKYGVTTCLFHHSSEAIEHSRHTGLINV